MNTYTSLYSKLACGGLFIFSLAVLFGHPSFAGGSAAKPAVGSPLHPVRKRFQIMFGTLDCDVLYGASRKEAAWFWKEVKVTALIRVEKVDEVKSRPEWSEVTATVLDSTVGAKKSSSVTFFARKKSETCGFDPNLGMNYFVNLFGESGFRHSECCSITGPTSKTGF